MSLSCHIPNCFQPRYMASTTVTRTHTTLSGRLLSRRSDQTLWIIFMAFRHFWLRTIQRRDTELASKPAWLTASMRIQCYKQAKQTQNDPQMNGPQRDYLPIGHGQSMRLTPDLTYQKPRVQKNPVVPLVMYFVLGTLFNKIYSHIILQIGMTEW